MREVLHKEDGLIVAVALTDHEVRLEIESEEGGPDLSATDEVVVIVDGRGCDLDIESANKATAVIAAEPEPLTLMVRIYEFFEGWDLFGDPA